MLFRRLSPPRDRPLKELRLGQNGGCDVSTANGPFVVLLSEDGANEAAAGRLGKMPTTSVRGRISLLRRSRGLLDQIFFQVGEWEVGEGQDVGSGLVQ